MVCGLQCSPWQHATNKHTLYTLENIATVALHSKSRSISTTHNRLPLPHHTSSKHST